MFERGGRFGKAELRASLRTPRRGAQRLEVFELLAGLRFRRSRATSSEVWVGVAAGCARLREAFWSAERRRKFRFRRSQDASGEHHRTTKSNARPDASVVPVVPNTERGFHRTSRRLRRETGHSLLWDYPSLVAPGGRALRCPHCQHDLFYQRSWLLNTPGMTFFGMEWLNDSATCYVCAQCGRIEWFTEVP